MISGLRLIGSLGRPALLPLIVTSVPTAICAPVVALPGATGPTVGFIPGMAPLPFRGLLEADLLSKGLKS